MKNQAFFKKNAYCVVKNAISEKTCQEIQSYMLAKIPGTFSRYGDPLLNDILVKLKSTIEQNTGLEVFPTYSYFKIYKNGDDLKPHTDRDSCEISASLCIAYNYDDSKGSWPLYLEDKPFYMKPGDMVIYKGIELTHSRKKLIVDDDSYHIQVFLHYVDKNGLYSDWKYDKKDFLKLTVDQ